jgi:hypothetical protein
MADKALEKVMKQNAATDLTVEQLIKQALKNM